MIKQLALVSVFVAGCGGGEALDSATASALTTAFAGDCMPDATYRALISSGAVRPLPDAIPDGAIWHAPFLLLPAVDVRPIEWAPGRFGMPVTVQGPAGPMTITGPYYEAEQSPDWLCKGI